MPESVIRLWRGKAVALVCEPTNPLLPVVWATAGAVVHIPCVSHGAFAHLDAYTRAVLHLRRKWPYSRMASQPRVSPIG